MSGDSSNSGGVGKQDALNLAKAVAFLALSGLMVWALSGLLTPTSRESHYVDAGIAHPSNTAEVVSVGASTLLTGFSPLRLYEEYGVCAVNRCSSSQAPITSYYVLQDAIRTQGGTLKTVLIDAKPFLANNGGSAQSAQAEKVISRMDMSMVRVGFAGALEQAYDDVDAMEQLIPVLRYHARWQSLTRDSYETLLGNTVSRYHGQYISFDSNATRRNSGKRTREVNDGITPETEDRVDTHNDLVDEERLVWLDKIMSLCAEHGLDAVLVVMPWTEWDDARHDYIESLAEDYGVPFLDLAVSDAWEECDFSYDTDFYDERHPNVIGSVKATDYIGRFLTSTYTYRDARGDSTYAFMESDLAAFDEAVEDGELSRCTELSGYLDRLDRSRYAVFVAAFGESFEGLGEVERDKLRELGLAQAAGLEGGESYIGVISNDGGVMEKCDPEGSSITLNAAFDGKTLTTASQKMQGSASMDHPLTIISIGKELSDNSGILLDGKRVSENKGGLNFVVYDTTVGLLVDTSSFDTHGNCTRLTDLPL